MVSSIVIVPDSGPSDLDAQRDHPPSGGSAMDSNGMRHQMRAYIYSTIRVRGLLPLRLIRASSINGGTRVEINLH